MKAARARALARRTTITAPGLLVALLALLLAPHATDARRQDPPAGEWRYIGGDVAHTRYSPLDQIDATNFSKLEVAWTWRGDNFGPAVDVLFRSTPLYVDGLLYTVASPIVAFIYLVNEYPVASILLRDTDRMTLAVGARQYLYEQRYLWGDFAAAAILSGLPITVLFLISQRFLISGLSEGSVKG